MAPLSIPTWIVILTLVVYCHACSPPDGVFKLPSIDAKIHYSDYFLWGKVKNIIRGGYDYDTMYTVEFEVYCTYKGGPLPQIITIVEAGKRQRYEPALCVSNDFKKGKEYLIYLDDAQEKGKYRPSFMEDPLNTPEETQLLDDVTLYCEVEQIDYPLGVTSSNAKKECPEAYPDYEGCMQFVETTTDPLKVHVKPMPENKPQPKGEPGYKEGSSEGGNGAPVESGNPEPVGDDRGHAPALFTSLCTLVLCLVIARL